jgi:hypothetical protein
MALLPRVAARPTSVQQWSNNLIIGVVRAVEGATHVTLPGRPDGHDAARRLDLGDSLTDLGNLTDRPLVWRRSRAPPTR